MKIDLPFTVVSTLIGAVLMPKAREYLPEAMSTLSTAWLCGIGAFVGMSISLALTPYSRENREHKEENS